MADNTFADFLSRVRAGDEQAAAELVRRYESERICVAAMTGESMRPVLPLLAGVRRRPSGGGRLPGGASGRAPHHPASAPAQLFLGQDPAGLAEPLRLAFPAPGYRVQVAGSGPGGLHVGAHRPDEAH
jgi:hypothetical protein